MLIGILSAANHQLTVMSLEYVVQAQCQTLVIDGKTIRNSETSQADLLMMSCSKIDIDPDDGSGKFEDCVNGVWMGPNFNGGEANYSILTNTYTKKIKAREVCTIL